MFCVYSAQGASNLQTVQGLQSVTLQNGQLILTGTSVGGAQIQQMQQQQAAAPVVITLPSVNQTTPTKSGKIFHVTTHLFIVTINKLSALSCSFGVAC
jgi:hypothetical protein